MSDSAETGDGAARRGSGARGDGAAAGDAAARSDAAGASRIFAADVLAGRVALVTGGGTGLGRATALELARCGAVVEVVGRREEILRGAVEEINSATRSERAGWLTGDVRARESAEGVISSTLERRGRLDVLVNNAGGQFFSPAELIGAKGWRAVWRLNVEGMLNMSETAVQLAFGPGGGGTIVNVTLSPHHGMPGMVHSGAARASVEALTRELAARWQARGVVVCAVAAGHFETEVLAKYPANVRAGAARSVPLQRLGTPAEHAWLVALLATHVGRAFSGSTVTLDGARDNWFGPWPPPGLADDAGEVPVEARKAPR
ncbi:MAG TPA: SDR family oxidoreductase [Solirubrobacteraceae bacterium]|nr:SDR family oxidoreductase [Solirubrobacteraceae bacterium]